MAVTEGPRVMVVDRHALYMAALEGLLTGLPLRAEVTTVARSDAALELLLAERYVLLLIGLRAQPLPGPEVAERLTLLEPATRVVLLAEVEDQALLLDALHGSATGFLTTDVSFDEFIDALRAVLAGHKVVGSRLLDTALSRLSRTGQSDVQDPLLQLSPAERSILAMVGQALSVASIADARGISPKTVRNHLASIYRKLDLRSRTEAVICAARMGLTVDVAAGMN